MKHSLSADQLYEAKTFARTFIDPAVMRAIMMKVYPKELFKVMVNAEMVTAATRYDEKTKTHIVYIGSNHSELEGMMGAGATSSIARYVQACFLHEIGHTLFTEKNLKDLSAKCDEYKIPFSLLNLAEDARIERLIRAQIEKLTDYSYRFGWSEWLKNPEISADMSPESILFYIINTEDSAVEAGDIRSSAKWYKRVSDYYGRFINAPDSYAVLEILREWKKEFHKDNNVDQKASMDGLEEFLESAMRNASPSGGGGGAPESAGDGKEDPSGKPSCGGIKDSPSSRSVSDLANAMALGSRAAAAAMDQMSIPYEDLKAKESSEPYLVNTSYGVTMIDDSLNTTKIFSAENRKGGVYEDELHSIRAMLMKMKKESKELVSTRSPAKRLNERALGMASTSFNTIKMYREKRVREASVPGKKILFMLDLSGSMGGQPADSQRTILLAANAIAAMERKFKVSVVGSKSMGSKSLYQALELPASEDVLLGCEANGSGEGIAYAIDNCGRLVREQDAIVFITDGNITDGAISNGSIDKHMKHGGISIGMYVGPGSIANPAMSEWFDHVIVEDDLTAAVEKMIALIEKGKPSVKVRNTVGSSCEAESRPGAGMGR